jgi:outer membrane protein OmpA-like peptidoglycan-associated protein
MLAKLIPAIAAAVMACSAAAQDVRMYAADEHVDPVEVARILDGQVETAAIKYRSLRLLDDKGSAVTSAKPQPSSLALPVQFAFDSAEILPSARSQLDALADGIRRLPANKAVTIEGHTDAVGTESYNRDLSVRRAQAVKQYLVQVRGIAASRLKTAGFGKDRPLDEKHPLAAENRRVQFRGA